MGPTIVFETLTDHSRKLKAQQAITCASVGGVVAISHRCTSHEKQKPVGKAADSAISTFDSGQL